MSAIDMAAFAGGFQPRVNSVLRLAVPADRLPWRRLRALDSEVYGMRFSRMRRDTVIAIAATHMLPAPVRAEALQCGKNLVMAAIAPLSGPVAATGQAYVSGIKAAVAEASKRDCKSELIVLDAFDPPRQLEAVLRAVTQDRARVVIGAFGYSIANLAATKVPDALLIDLQQSSASEQRPPNLVALPYADLFFTTAPDARTASLELAGHTAAAIVLDTVRTARQGSLDSVRDLIDEMAKQEFKTKAGSLTLDSKSGTFKRKL